MDNTVSHPGVYWAIATKRQSMAAFFCLLSAQPIVCNLTASFALRNTKKAAGIAGKEERASRAEPNPPASRLESC